MNENEIEIENSCINYSQKNRNKKGKKIDKIRTDKMND